MEEDSHIQIAPIFTPQIPEFIKDCELLQKHILSLCGFIAASCVSSDENFEPEPAQAYIAGELWKATPFILESPENAVGVHIEPQEATDILPWDAHSVIQASQSESDDILSLGVVADDPEKWEPLIEEYGLNLGENFAELLTVTNFQLPILTQAAEGLAHRLGELSPIDDIPTAMQARYMTVGQSLMQKAGTVMAGV